MNLRLVVADVGIVEQRHRGVSDSDYFDVGR